MDRQQLRNRKIENFLHSAVLLGGMVLLLAVLGSLVLGRQGITLAIVAGLVLLALGPRLSPRWVMRLHRARPLGPYEAPQLAAMVRELARRAELPRAPQLYYVPAAVPNAFAVGDVERSAVGVTDGLLRRLNQRELAGVLAHELSHLRSHDLKIMGLADAVSRMTRMLALFGQVVLLLSLPLALLGQVTVPWLTILLLLAAPTASALLQLALSRTREFDADLDAVRLTGDPAGLASALAKLDLPPAGWLQRILLPYRREAGASLLRTHPATEERIRRLRSLVKTPQRPPAPRRIPVRRVRPRVRRVPVHGARVPVRGIYTDHPGLKPRATGWRPAG